MTPNTILSAEQALHAVQGDVPVFRDLGEEEVEDDDGHEAGDKALCTRFPDAAGARAAVDSFVAGDVADRAAEEDAFHQALVALPMVDAHAREFPVGGLGHAE